MMIIKIGGGASINLEGIIKDLARQEEPFIIVHGANALRDQLAEKLKQPKKVITSVSGYSSVFSDEAAIDVMMMAYSGLRNKRIIELCQRNGINAVGLTGLDGRVIQGRRNRGIKVKEEGRFRLLRDFSGKPQSVNADLLNLLLDNGYIPVLTVPICDEDGFAINSENDDIVNTLQEQIKADVIIQLIEAPGFLDNPKDQKSLVPELSQLELASREEQVEGRMKRKMLALKKLFESGAQKVIISDGRVDQPISDALTGKGTVIQ
ncbi:MAG: [LysW]-aminoadipate kinase [Calditrichaceae bacterium]|nr:[LysW]-aminoadipate kinase [Calditrichaceae bacterium]MBN2709545.1 [LysW]-aminoadipate kinase [Calditrichaceae bacterium]RQV96806.1 MAG: [LysW]-aminoadipate kinase [Calditrichota bacterium]